MLIALENYIEARMVVAQRSINWYNVASLQVDKIYGNPMKNGYNNACMSITTFYAYYSHYYIVLMIA